jgi:hypothetical protein
MKGRNQRKMGTGWKKERDEMKKKVPLRAGWEVKMKEEETKRKRRERKTTGWSERKRKEEK